MVMRLALRSPEPVLALVLGAYPEQRRLHLREPHRRGCVIHGARLDVADQSLETRAEHLQRLTERGLPRLSELLPIAWRQLAELPEEGLDPAWRPPLLEKILEAMRYHRPGGLFTVFAARAGQLSPELMRP
ncbi:MAG TPA: hypothetical protein VIV12_01400 [Streptosporangiaceae bacterium]